MGAAIVTPLRKRRLSGELYERDPTVEALIAELAALPREELIARAAITKRADPGYVPSECLVYFIRASRNDKWRSLVRASLSDTDRAGAAQFAPGGKL